MNLRLNTLTASLGAAIMLTPLGSAKTGPVCHTGKLLDVQENTELVPDVQVVQARQSKNGKDWTTIALPPSRRQTTYVVKMALNGIIYTARSSGDFWGYNPSGMIVNGEVEACVDSKRLVITRPDGKEYRPTIIRRERTHAAPSGN